MLTGENNLQAAKATIVEYFFTSQLPIDSVFWAAWDTKLVQLVENFNTKSNHIKAFSYNPDTWWEQLKRLVISDVKFAFFAVSLIIVYSAIFLGSCSPIHCRLSLALGGVSCILISIIVGEAVCYMSGWKASVFTSVLPILMCGIGVDDMFVICNALDQQSLDHSPSQRVKQGLRHAGPSITITSLTNAMAFLIGSNSSLIGI